MTGLEGSDTVVNRSESYVSPIVGTEKTLQVAGYTIVDGNGGKNYAVTTVANYNGVITRAPSVFTLDVADNGTANAPLAAAAKPAVVTLGVTGESTGFATPPVKADSRKAKVSSYAAAWLRSSAAEKRRHRAIEPADAARDRVVEKLVSSLRADLLADRIAGRNDV